MAGLLDSLYAGLRNAYIGATTAKGANLRNYGFPGEIAAGVVDPYVRQSQRNLELANILSQGAMQQGEPTQYVPTFLNEQDRGELSNNPLRFASRAGADMLAGSLTAIPGGALPTTGLKGLAAAAGLGAAGGALSSIGGAGEKEDLLSAGVMGGLLGGGLGAGAYGIGKGVQKLSKGAQRVIPKATGDIDIDAEAFKQLDNIQSPAGIKKGFLENIYAKDIGIKPQTQKISGNLDFAKQFSDDVLTLDKAREFYGLPRSKQGISQLAELVGNDRNALIEKSQNIYNLGLKDLATPNNISDIKLNIPGKNISSNDAKSALGEALVKALPQGEYSDDVLNSIRGGFDTAKNLRAGDLQYIAENTRDAAFRVSKGKASTAGDFASSKIHEWAKGQLEKDIPSYANYNKVFTTLYRQNPSIVNAQIQGMGNRFVASPQGIAQQFANKGETIASKGLLNAMNIGEKLTGLANKPQIQGLAAGMAKNAPTIGRLGGAIFGGSSTGNAQMESGIPSVSANGAPQTGQEMVQQPQVGGLSDYFGAQEAQAQQAYGQTFMQLMAQGYKPSDAKAIAEAVAPKSKPVPTKIKEQAANMDSAMMELERVKGMALSRGEDFGPIAGRLGGLTSALGINPQGAASRTATAVVRQKLAKALEGGRLTDADRRFYEQYLPTNDDSPEQVIAKVGVLQDLLYNQQKNLIGSYENQSLE